MLCIQMFWSLVAGASVKTKWESPRIPSNIEEDVPTAIRVSRSKEVKATKKKNRVGVAKTA